MRYIPRHVPHNATCQDATCQDAACQAACGADRGTVGHLPRSARDVGLSLAAVLVAFTLGCSGGDGDAAGDGEAGPGAAQAAVPADEAPHPSASEWLLVEGGGEEGQARIELAREAARGANSTGTPPTLHLACVDGRPEVSVIWYEDPEGSDNDVETRVDDGREVRRTWTNRHEDSSVFPPDSAGVFIDRLAEGDSLTVQSNLYKRMPITAVFALDGLGERIQPVRDACDW